MDSREDIMASLEKVLHWLEPHGCTAVASEACPTRSLQGM